MLETDSEMHDLLRKFENQDKNYLQAPLGNVKSLA